MIFLAYCVVLLLATYKILPMYTVLVVPALYIFVITPPTFGACVKPTANELRPWLQDRWKDATDLATYMNQHWGAISNAGTAYIHQRQSMKLGMAQFAVALIVVWKGKHDTVGVVALIEAVVLAITACRVNKPYRMYLNPKVRGAKDADKRKEWLLAVSSLVAYGELYPDNVQSAYIAKGILNTDEDAFHAVSEARLGA